MRNLKINLLFLIASMLLLSGCLDEDRETRLVPVVAPIDISGIWVGTWSGYDPEWGDISGTWEVDITIDGKVVQGNGVLSGDIDCTDGVLSGTMNQDYLVTGELERDWCGINEWLLTSFSLVSRQMSGYWTKSSIGGEGTFTGVQVATRDGPRIRSVYPPSGLPGTIVTITGERFQPDPALSFVDFNGIAATGIEVLDDQHIIAEVPVNASLGPVTVARQDPDGVETGRSVLSFNTAVTYPSPDSINAEIYVYASNTKGIAALPTGRRVFVLSSDEVIMVDVVAGVSIGASQYVESGKAIVASPDNRYVYALTGTRIVVLNAGLNQMISEIKIPYINSTGLNPHSLAITPDGKRLLVAASGSNVVYEIDVDVDYDGTAYTDQVVNTVYFNAPASPEGIAISNDGHFAYIALHAINKVKEYDLRNRTITNTYDVGVDPTGLVVNPDGTKLYVTNTVDGTVSVIDLVNDVVTNTVPVETEPTGIAMSPDGARVYTANYGSDTVSIIETATDTLITTVTGLSNPVAVTMMPDGHRVYVSSADRSYISQIGGPITLTVNKTGGGTGDVTSIPAGISCGTQCRAEYELDTDVTLTAVATSGSTFNGWYGDCSGTSSQVTVKMDQVRNCVVAFDSEYSDTNYSDDGSTYYTYNDNSTTNYNCFIATAAYGSYMDQNVEALRQFRDRYLMNNMMGRAFVDWYYMSSPPVARFVQEHDALRFIVRLVLTPFVYAVTYPVVAILLITVLVGWYINHRRASRYDHS
jgi:YVTN family beta-propeller protein